MILLIGSQKGGVGKSTLLVNIGGYISKIGKLCSG
jgi:cellulose biosynthesis protein BcsQ